MIRSIAAAVIVGLLGAVPAAAQAPPQKRIKLMLTQQEIFEIGKLADKAPFEEVVGLESDIQSQINADAAADKAAANKADADAKAQERATIEAEVRAKIEKEKATPSPSKGETP